MAAAGGGRRRRAPPRLGDGREPGTGEPGSGLRSSGCGLRAACLRGCLFSVRGWGGEWGVRVRLLGFGGLLGWLGLVFAQLASRLASQSDPARLGSTF